MKKILAIILSLSLLFSLSGCMFLEAEVEVETEKPTEIIETETTEQNVPKVSEVENIYNTVISLTKADLSKKYSIGDFDFWEYNGILLTHDDCEFINAAYNKKGDVNQGAIYRGIANILATDIGLDSKGNEFKYTDDCKAIFGVEDKTQDEYIEMANNAVVFITPDNSLENVMKKFETLNSVKGDFDFDYKSFGKFNIDIADLSACAREMQISEEMLGYILAMLDEYAVKITFSGNSCYIEYASYY